MRCRICNTDLGAEPLIKFENMPKSAQFFPTSEDATNEKGVNLDLYQCSSCGAIQLAGEPVPYYRDVIRAVGVSEELKRYRINQFSKWLNKYNLVEKKIIEIGCGTGDFTDCMIKAGAAAVGYEHSASSVNKARKNGIPAINGFIENEHEEIEGAPYDGFFIMNFLEHIPNPNAFLKGISHNLKDGGYGLVEVPNGELILEKNLYTELIQDHLFYYTEKSLRLVLELNGFEIISIEEIRTDYVLSAEVRKKEKTDVSGFVGKREQLMSVFNDFFAEMADSGRTIAVWGAGHQALATMSNMHMEYNVKYVIDSAEFKQNHLTPASHIPIVSPQVLAEGKIGAVIIMAGSYSDEIGRIMKKEYPGILYAILREDGSLERSDRSYK